jgi:hypothetical protein
MLLATMSPDCMLYPILIIVGVIIAMNKGNK